MAVSSPDPVREPQGYQAHLLGLLADDDPATVQASTPAALRALVQGAGEQLRDRPAPAEWSVFGCLAHVTDAELVMSTRYRFVLAEDEPPLIGYDQDRWVDRLHGDAGSPQALLELFDTLRGANHPVGVDVATGPSPRGDARRTRPRELGSGVPHDRRPRSVPPETGARSARRRSRLTPGRAQDRREQRDRAGLVERLVAVPAFR